MLSGRNVKNLGHVAIVKQDKSYYLGKSVLFSICKFEFVFPARRNATFLPLLVSLVFWGDFFGRNLQ